MKDFFNSAKEIYENVKAKTYIWLLNKFVAKGDEYYGFTEPSPEWMIMHNKRFWIQPTKSLESATKPIKDTNSIVDVDVYRNNENKINEIIDTDYIDVVKDTTANSEEVN